MRLKSVLLNVTCDDLTLTQQIEAFGITEFFNSLPPAHLQFMVFKTILRDGITKKKVYCCLSGGELNAGDLKLTPTGKAALAMLMLIPAPLKHKIIFQELRIGRTPLSTKVKQTIQSAPAGSKICFFGDMSGELDGKMLDILGWNKVIENINVNQEKAQ
jgi:hypothetical protein